MKHISPIASHLVYIPGMSFRILSINMEVWRFVSEQPFARIEKEYL